MGHQLDDALDFAQKAAKVRLERTQNAQNIRITLINQSSVFQMMPCLV
jgi:hypothetical protein